MPLCRRTGAGALARSITVVLCLHYVTSAIEDYGTRSAISPCRDSSGTRGRSGFCCRVGGERRKRRRAEGRQIFIGGYSSRSFQDAPEAAHDRGDESGHRKPSPEETCAPLIRTSWSVSSRATPRVRQS